MHPGVLLALAGVVAIFLLVWFFGRGLGVPPPVVFPRYNPHEPLPVPLLDIPVAVVADVQRLYDVVASAAHEGAWVCFMPPPTNLADSEVVQLQFSLENERPGFDWVLLAPVNLRDQAAFEELAKSMGIDLGSGQLNGVDYLRTEDEGCVELCRRVLVEMYGADESTDLSLVFDEFGVTLEHWMMDPPPDVPASVTTNRIAAD